MFVYICTSISLEDQVKEVADILRASSAELVVVSIFNELSWVFPDITVVPVPPTNASQGM